MVAATMLSHANTSPASAVTEVDHACIDILSNRNLTYKFDASWSTIPDAAYIEPYLSVGLQSVEVENLMSGAKVVNWSQSTGSDSSVNLLMSISSSMSDLASTTCTLSGSRAKITFKASFIETADHPNLWNSVRHESMHALGLTHTGKYDSRDGGGKYATMKTCDSQVNSYSSIVQDDASGLQFVGSSTSQNYRVLSADPGLDSTYHYFGVTGGGSTSPSLSGGVDGTGRLVFTSPGGSSAVYSTTRVMMGTPDRAYVARGAARVTNANAESATLNMELWSRWVDYPSNTQGNANGCSYDRPYIWEPNNEPLGANMGTMTKRERSSTAYLSTAWSTRSSSPINDPTNPNFVPNPEIKDAHDLQWRAVAHAFDSSGNPLQVDLDNLRVESKSIWS